jgi:hypothetical protein
MKKVYIVLLIVSISSSLYSMEQTQGPKTLTTPLLNGNHNGECRLTIGSNDSESTTSSIEPFKGDVPPSWYEIATYLPTKVEHPALLTKLKEPSDIYNFIVACDKWLKGKPSENVIDAIRLFYKATPSSLLETELQKHWNDVYTLINIIDKDPNSDLFSANLDSYLLKTFKTAFSVATMRHTGEALKALGSFLLSQQVTTTSPTTINSTTAVISGNALKAYHSEIAKYDELMQKYNFTTSQQIFILQCLLSYAQALSRIRSEESSSISTKLKAVVKEAWGPKRDKLIIYGLPIILTCSYMILKFIDYDLNKDKQTVLGFIATVLIGCAILWNNGIRIRDTQIIQDFPKKRYINLKAITRTLEFKLKQLAEENRV